MSLRKTFNKVPECFAGAQQGEGGGWRPPLLFFENQKKCPDFRKKGLDCVHPYVKCTIQNVVLRVCKRKNSLWGLFSRIFDKMFIGVP